MSSCDTLGLDRREENPVVNTSWIVVQYGRKALSSFAAEDSLRHSIMEHIHENRPEFKEMLDQLAPGEEGMHLHMPQ